MTTSGVSYDDGTVQSVDGTGVAVDAVDGVFTLTVTNSSGHELPNAGGSGTAWLTALGVALMAVGALTLGVRLRRA